MQYRNVIQIVKKAGGVYTFSELFHWKMANVYRDLGGRS